MDAIKKMTTSLQRFVLVAIVALAVTACGGDDSDPRSDARALQRSINSSPESIDIHKFSSTEAGNVLRDLGEGLTSYTAAGKLIPGVAERWEVSADGVQYAFYLRPDAKWSNGDEVLAADFVAAYRRLVTPSTAAVSSKFVAMVKNAKAILRGELEPGELGVAAVDDRTLSITLESPTPYLLQLLTHPSMFPIHVPSLEAHADKFTRPGNLVTNGAYRLKNETAGFHIELERNEHYWDNDSTWFDQVHYHVIAESAEISRFRSGELDITAYVNADQFEFVKEKYPNELKVSPALGVYYYGFNLTKPLLRDNPKLRRALSMAIDRDTLVRAVIGRGEKPSYGWVPPGIDNYTSQPLDYADWSQEERNAEARRLYVEAGYGPDNPLSIELRYNTKGGHGKTALAIQAMWREVLGFEVELINEEFQVMLANIRQMEITELFRLSWSGDYNDAWTFLQLVETDNPQNLTAYRNDVVDGLLQKAATEVDLDVRRGYLQQAERLSLADHPIIPLYFYVTKHLVAADIEGWEPMPLNYHYSRHLSRSASSSE